MAGRLPMFLEKKWYNNYIKPSTEKRNKNRRFANLHRKNDLLKATMSQRHKDYYGFVKTGFETRRPKGASAIILFQHFGATWSILVPCLTPSDFEAGLQIDYFWKIAKKNKKKGGPRSGFKKTWFVDRFLMLKWEAWNCKKEVFALYLLQITRFRRSGKLIEKVMPKVIQNFSKIWLWVRRGPTFEILGGFDRGPIFDDCLSGQKKENLKKWGGDVKNGSLAQGSAELPLLAEELLEFAKSKEFVRVCKEFGTPCLLRAGRGGLLSLRECRRPTF